MKWFWKEFYENFKEGGWKFFVAGVVTWLIVRLIYGLVLLERFLQQHQ